METVAKWEKSKRERVSNRWDHIRKCSKRVHKRRSGIWEGESAYLRFYWLNVSWTRGFELITRGFELVTLIFELATRGFELVTHKVEPLTCEFELVDLNSYFWISTLAFKLLITN